MKTFCILEQGNKIGEDLTLKKKKIFSTKFSDLFRLNWSGLNDPEAFISQKNITWSEVAVYYMKKYQKIMIIIFFVMMILNFIISKRQK